MSVLSWLSGLLAGGVTGLLSAFGLGGGTLLLLWLTLFAGLPQQTAQAINLIYFLPVALASLPAHFRNGFLQKRPVCWAAGAGALTAAAAAFLATGLDTELLRKCFGGYLLTMGLVELLGRGRKGNRRECSDSLLPQGGHHRREGDGAQNQAGKPKQGEPPVEDQQGQ